VNEVWLKFEDFPPLKLIRKKPPRLVWDVFYVKHISNTGATFIIWAAVIGFALSSIRFGIAVFNLADEIFDTIFGGAFKILEIIARAIFTAFARPDDGQTIDSPKASESTGEKPYEPHQ
jgi:hypothetical protein